MGLVADDAGGNLSSGDQLLEASKPVQHRLGRRCRDRYALSADFQKVLFGFVARLQLQRHGMFFGCGGDGGFGSGELADGAGENLRGVRSRSSVMTTGVRGVSRNDPGSSSTSAGRGTMRTRPSQAANPGRQAWTAKIRNRRCFTVWILVERLGKPRLQNVCRRGASG